MNTITPLAAEQAPITAQPYFADGDPGPIVAALAHVPELLEAALPCIAASLGPSAIDLRTKEIVVVRTSARLSCRYCTDTHTVVARDAGMTTDEVRALRGELPATVAFDDEAELALLDWIDAVAACGGRPPETVAAAMTAHWREHEIVELTWTVGATMLLNRFASSLGLPVSEDTRHRLDADGFAA